MISPGLRIAVLICSFLTIFALNLVSAFADVTDTTRHQLAIGTGRRPLSRSSPDRGHACDLPANSEPSGHPSLRDSAGF